MDTEIGIMADIAFMDQAKDIGVNV